MVDNLTSKTLGGLAWSYLSVFVTACLQILYTAIMARLLAPSMFGVVAMANILLGFGSYFARMGIGPALVQKKDLSEEDIRAAFTASLLISLLVTLVIFFLAPLSRLVFGNADVVPVVRAMSLSLFAVGSTSTASYLLRRNFQFRFLMIAEIISFAAGVFIGIALAYLGFGVWSLVICNLIQASGVGIVSYWFSRHSIKLTFHWSSHKAILSFSSQLSLVSFFEFINYNLDTMVIGRLLGPALLGIYNRSYYIISLPSQQISASLTKVLFSSLSKIQNEVDKLREAYQMLIVTLGLILFAFGFSVSAASREIVLILLGPKWEDAIPILRILALAVPFSMLVMINGILFDATARLKIKIVLVLARLSLLISLFVMLFRYGLAGFASAVLVTEVIYYVAQTTINKKFLSIPTKDILSLHAPVLGVALFEFLLVRSITWLFNDQHVAVLITLIVQILTAGSVLVFIILIRPPKVLVAAIRKTIDQIDPSVFPQSIYRFSSAFLSKHLLPDDRQ